MTLQQMYYTAVIADNKSINRAAAELGVKQPSLSEAVKGLEKELGIRIFTRSSKGVQLTEEGRKFLENAAPILREAVDLSARYREADGSREAEREAEE